MGLVNWVISAWPLRLPMPSIMQREFACETIPSRSISSSTSCRPSCDAGSAHVLRPIDVGEFVGIPGNKPRTGQQVARADVAPSFDQLRKITSRSEEHTSELQSLISNS